MIIIQYHHCYVVLINCVVKQDPFFDFIRHGETEMEDIRYHIKIFPLSPLSVLKDVFRRETVYHRCFSLHKLISHFTEDKLKVFSNLTLFQYLYIQIAADNKGSFLRYYYVNCPSCWNGLLPVLIITMIFRYRLPTIVLKIVADKAPGSFVNLVVHFHFHFDQIAYRYVLLPL